MRKLVQMMCAALVLAPSMMAQDVRIGVLGLFHPQELILSPVTGAALIVQVGQEKFVLEKSSRLSAVRIRTDGNAISAELDNRTVRATEMAVQSRQGGPVHFFLSVPNKLERQYYGTLHITQQNGSLVAIVNMDAETAVASIVDAESLSDTPTEALKAQAVAARSYLVAGKGRHSGYDFCDTTHCQFLRQVPAPDAPAAKAALTTRGTVLSYQSQIFAAMYTRSCSGRTHVPRELKMTAASYPYFSVSCKYCREHPIRWQSQISAADAKNLYSSDEASRLKIDRQFGWNTVASNDFSMQEKNGRMLLTGTGHGHGIGLCQLGAKAMAKDGASYLQILAHYYPNAIVTNTAGRLSGKFPQSVP